VVQRLQLEQAETTGGANDENRSKLESNLADSQANLEVERERLRNTEDQLTERNQNLQDMEVQCLNMKKELEAAKSDLQQDNLKAIGLEQELGDTVTMAGELQADLEKCQKELEKMTEFCSHKDDELEQKTEEIVTLEEKTRLELGYHKDSSYIKDLLHFLMTDFSILLFLLFFYWSQSLHSQLVILHLLFHFYQTSFEGPGAMG